MRISDNEHAELTQFMDVVSAVERSFDLIVIDTSGSDSFLMRLAHAMADTLVTLINDSFLDFDGLGRGSRDLFRGWREPLCRDGPDGRQKRRRFDGTSPDWIVVRSDRATRSCLPTPSNACPFVSGFRSIEGLVERTVYRELLPRGLTALDDLDGARLGPVPA